LNVISTSLSLLFPTTTLSTHQGISHTFNHAHGSAFSQGQGRLPVLLVLRKTQGQGGTCPESTGMTIVPSICDVCPVYSVCSVFSLFSCSTESLSLHDARILGTGRVGKTSRRNQ
jgi:hypothetical protein